MRMFVIEGSATELAEMARELSGAQDVAVSLAKTVSSKERDSQGKTSNADETVEFVTEKFAKTALSRLPLSKPMVATLRKLKEKPERWTPAHELHEASNYDFQQFAGLMGAFGRRMAHTNGYDIDAHFFETRWDEDAEEWSYRLPKPVLSALESTNI